MKYPENNYFSFVSKAVLPRHLRALFWLCPFSLVSTSEWQGPCLLRLQRTALWCTFFNATSLICYWKCFWEYFLRRNSVCSCLFHSNKEMGKKSHCHKAGSFWMIPQYNINITVPNTLWNEIRRNWIFVFMWHHIIEMDKGTNVPDESWMITF